MTKENKNKYWWVRKLVDKITKTGAPLNNHFYYYDYEVYQMSGTVDYTAVTISTKYHPCQQIVDFSFDFWTKELHFVSYIDENIRISIIKAFTEFYDNVNVSDETIVKKKNKV